MYGFTKIGVLVHFMWGHANDDTLQASAWLAVFNIVIYIRGVDRPSAPSPAFLHAMICSNPHAYRAGPRFCMQCQILLSYSDTLCV